MVICMKTTLNLDDAVIRAAKERAARTDRTLTSIVEEALRQLIRQETEPVRGYRFDAKPVKGRLRAGVDLSDRKSLYDTMDARA
jgi:hypothetical protein